MLTVTFDQVLQPGFSAKANWEYQRTFTQKRLCSSVPVIAGKKVTMTMNITQPTPFNPLGVEYTGRHPDIIGNGTGYAVPFANFPVT